MATIYTNGPVNNIVFLPKPPATPPTPPPAVAYIPFGVYLVAYLTGGLRVAGTFTAIDRTQRTITITDESTGNPTVVPAATSKVHINAYGPVTVIENNYYTGPINAFGPVNVYENNYYRRAQYSSSTGAMEAYFVS